MTVTDFTPLKSEPKKPVTKQDKQEELVDQLLQAPSLSSALYILYWNLTLDDVARRELGDLRLLINKEEARRSLP